MLFRPWLGDWADPWVVFHQGTYWLYHVEREGGLGVAIGLSRSSDGVHWVEDGRVLTRGDDARSLGAGSVWRAPTFERDGRLVLGFTEERGPEPGRASSAIHLAVSTDLAHWQRMGPEYVFRPDPRWYRWAEPGVHWHDFTTLVRGEGGRYGYWTADPLSGEPAFGFGTTMDCCHWRALPPPVIDWQGRGAPSSLRMAGVARIGGRYLAFVEAPRATREQHCVYLLLADDPGGPFTPAPRNYQVLATTAQGGGGLGLRLVTLDGEALVSHMATTCHGERWLAPIKRLHVEANGSAWLAYWPGNEVLRGERLAVSLGEPELNPGGMRIAMLDPSFDAGAGVMLEGRWDGLPTQESDVFLGGGLYIETEQGDGEGILVPMLGQALAGPMSEGDATLRLEDSVDRELPYSASAGFRLLLRGELAELYVDDLLMCSVGLPARATGRVGLVTAGHTQVHDLRAHRLAL